MKISKIQDFQRKRKFKLAKYKSVILFMLCTLAYSNQTPQNDNHNLKNKTDTFISTSESSKNNNPEPIPSNTNNPKPISSDNNQTSNPITTDSSKTLSIESEETKNLQNDPNSDKKEEKPNNESKPDQSKDDTKTAKPILSDNDDELGKIKGEIKKEENNNLAISIILISLLILINNFIIDKINNLKKKCKCLEFLQNPLITLLLGIISGVFVKIFEANSIIQTIKSGFQEFFMIILLPPILFASALNMNKFYFFKNFGAILILAFIGTFIAIIVNSILLFSTNYLNIGSSLSMYQSIIFSVLISATDPVTVLITFEGYSCNPNLYSLIFGESILNDAITLALYRSLRDNQAQSSDWYIMKQTFLKFIILIICSCMIALIVGFSISFIMKKTYKRIQLLNDKINFKRTVLESSKFENLNFQPQRAQEDEVDMNISLVKINSLIQKKNNLVNRQTSMMMISPLMSYLVAEVILYFVLMYSLLNSRVLCQFCSVGSSAQGILFLTCINSLKRSLQTYIKPFPRTVSRWRF